MPTIEHRCAVLGKPIAHSLSPVLHNAAYRSLGLSGWQYDRHEVDEAHLDAFLRSLNADWAGLSLTMPLKRTIQPYGEPSNLWARELGVANTVVFDWQTPGRVEGLPAMRLYNTDVVGIQLAFDHAYREQAAAPASPARTGTAVVIGNGNTAASAVAALTMMPQIGHIVVAARHPGKNPVLQAVASRFLPTADPFAEIALDDTDTLLRRLAAAAVVVNTIPGHAADATAAALEAAREFQPHGMLLDVVYDPRPTRLMSAWRHAGGHAIGGEEMLLYQALIQVLLMTGVWDGDPPSDADRRLQDVTTDDDHLEIAMRTALEEALR